MASQSTVQFRAACMALYSFSFTSQLVLNQLMDDRNMPIWHVMMLCNAFCLGPISLWCWLDGQASLSTSQVKWMMVRAAFVVLSFIFGTLGIRISRAPGDVNALTSINVVAASAIGHLFLNERLRWMHSLAVLCSFAGAMIIAKPEFLFGKPDSGVSLVLGYVFALMSGLSRAAAMVCARKVGQVPTSFVSASTCMAGLLMFLLLPHTPLLENQPLTPAWVAPGLGVLTLGGNLVSMVTSSVSGPLGSMLCPAAVSATVFTASGMVFGYLAQALLLNQIPDPLTLFGAALVLLAVIIMTAFRVRQPAGADSDDVVEEARAPAAKCSAEQKEVPSDDESLFSFAAAEFAEFEAHSNHANSTVRLRRPAVASGRPDPQSLGAAAKCAVTGAFAVLPGVASI